MTDASPPRRRIDLAQLDSNQSYFFLISAIAPRPIAWVSTRGPDGSTNLAPFSFFQGVSADPPMLMLSIFREKSSGGPKDTLTNILATREFVVNLASETLLNSVVESSAELPYGASEIEALGLATFPGERVAAPCVADAPVNFECRLHRELPIGRAVVVFGEILLVHVREDVLDARGGVDPLKLRPVGRLGGSLYAPLRDVIVKKRP